MNLLEQIRTRMHRRLLRKQPPSQLVNRTSISLEKADSVGIIFDGTTLEEREMVLNYAKQLKGQGKKVKLLAFFGKDLGSEALTFKYFNKKQLDWALRPKVKVAEEFAQQQFDLLINLSKKAIPPLDYIAAHSKARFRVGPSTKQVCCYDMMIEQGEKQGLEAFLKLVTQYLKNMQPGQMAATI